MRVRDCGAPAIFLRDTAFQKGGPLLRKEKPRGGSDVLWIAHRRRLSGTSRESGLPAFDRSIVVGQVPFFGTCECSQRPRRGYCFRPGQRRRASFFFKSTAKGIKCLIRVGFRCVRRAYSVRRVVRGAKSGALLLWYVFRHIAYRIDR